MLSAVVFKRFTSQFIGLPFVDCQTCLTSSCAVSLICGLSGNTPQEGYRLVILRNILWLLSEGCKLLTVGWLAIFVLIFLSVFKKKKLISDNQGCSKSQVDCEFKLWWMFQITRYGIYNRSNQVDCIKEYKLLWKIKSWGKLYLVYFNWLSVYGS